MSISNEESQSYDGVPKSAIWRLLLASFAALYFELIVIRFLSTEIRIFAYLKNVALIASFFGIGLGMATEKPFIKLKRYFPWLCAVLFVLMTFASFLKLTHLPIPTFDYRVFTDQPEAPTGNWLPVWVFLMIFVYVAVVPAILFLVVAFFTVLGRLVSEQIRSVPSLRGYGVNLVGSLAGIAAFTAISFLGTPPLIWVLIGLIALAPFFFRQRWALVAFGLTLVAMAIPQQRAYWSPYYRVAMSEVAPPPGWSHAPAYMVDVNHDYHQKMLDLTPGFVSQYPNFEPNRSSLSSYELPYRLVQTPKEVLVVGAGTGNDVAAALRHGATHVDAVEIDPLIQELGRKYHPEHPYDSPRVTVHINDARAFFKKAPQKYDLIVFGYLDSQTLLTSLSSIRLDNYVYTLQSFQEARKLLNENGTVVLAFGAGKTFLTERLFTTLSAAFGREPLAYYTGYDASGVVFVEGKAAETNQIADFPEISKELKTHEAGALMATDHWPFLYLESRTIPFSIWSILALFVYLAISLLQRHVPLRELASRQGLHLFFLGAGFMLLETKGVTELSLFFGSTWVVNSVVIAAFLTMGLLANTFVMFYRVPRIIAYVGLFLVLAASMLIPYSFLEILPTTYKVLASASLAGLPVFFSGLIFSSSFRAVTQPAQALGFNLLGAVVGGVLENLVMVGGTSILGVVALLLYGFSASVVPKVRKEESVYLGEINAAELSER
jgi:SAM-dependent methyltransferase